jgi:plastocyanin
MKLRIGIPFFLIAIVLVGSVALLLTRPARGMGEASAASAGHALSMNMNMSDAEMAAMGKQYWATHTRVAPASSVPATVNALVDTFTVANFMFDADHNLGTPVDTVRVALNDAVLFLWQNGTHTATSGTGSLDPNEGLLFDVPLDAFDTTFQFSSAVAETVPFFCSIHESFGMKGAIIVFDPLTGVGNTPVGAGIGFASHPWPNPTGGRVNFRYSLKQAGHVRAEVLDVRGRRVATVLDLDRGPGTFDAAWDGRLASGRTAPTGRYFLYLAVPGAVGSQAITLMR